jgi:hypothetical protein
MVDVDVTFDVRKLGGAANPVTVTPAVVPVRSGARERIRFTLRTLGGGPPAGFDFTPAVFSPDSPIHFEEPMTMGGTSFTIVDENENRGSLPRRLYCTLWIRYDGQSYPALYPTIINEPLRPRAAVPETSDPVSRPCG